MSCPPFQSTVFRRRRRTAPALQVTPLPSGFVTSDRGGESRDGVALTHLDEPLFDGAGATKRDLVDYLDGVRDRIIPALRNRPLWVTRVHRGQEAFMQKNVPKYAPSWIQTARFWAETSK